MPVNVVRLRVEGVARSRDEVLADDPARGVVLLRRPPCSPNYWHRLYAGLMDPDGWWLLSVLDPATVHRISARGMLIRGNERIQLERSKEALFARAWWCRPVTRRSCGRDRAAAARWMDHVQSLPPGAR